MKASSHAENIKLASRKEISRFSKKELCDMLLKEGIDCKKSDSKQQLLAYAMKKSDFRRKILIKPPRALSQKQRQALEKHRFKNTISIEQDNSAVIRTPKESVSISKPNPKSKVKVDPTASNKVEPVPVSLKENVKEQVKKSKEIAEETPKLLAPKNAGIPKFLPEKETITDIKTGEKSDKEKVKSLLIKIDEETRDKASLNAEKLHQQLGGTNADASAMRSVDSHTMRLKRASNLRGMIENTRKNELGKSILLKSSDLTDRKIFDKITKKNKKLLEHANERSKHVEERNFDGDLDEVGIIDLDPSKLNNEEKLRALLSLQSSLNAGIISQEEYNRELVRFEEKQQEETRKVPISSERRQRIEELQERLKEIEKKKNLP